MKVRRYDIDWIRVIATLFVFLFHCTRFYDGEGWHVVAPASQQNEILSIVRGYLIWVWLMEIFFLVSGFATFYSLKNRSAGQFLVERVKRLLIPMYTIGLVLLIPPQYYFELYTHGRVTSTFWQWLPSYFLSLPRSIFSIPQISAPQGLVPYTFSGHFWFMQLLFLVSLVTLPILLYLKSEAGQKFIGRLATWSNRPVGIFLFAVPLIIIRVGLMWFPLPSDWTWAEFLWYACFFVYGYILAAEERFSEALRKNAWLALAIWLILFPAVGGTMLFALDYEPTEGQGFSVLFMVWEISYSLISWGAIAFILSLFAKYFKANSRLLQYGNEAVLPFYLLHQTVILIAGWFLLPLFKSGLVSFLVIAAVSFLTIVLLYEICIKRIPLMRFLFGMPPKKG
jgi:glucan biosynthesis protein C